MGHRHFHADRQHAGPPRTRPAQRAAEQQSTDRLHPQSGGGRYADGSLLNIHCHSGHGLPRSIPPIFARVDYLLGLYHRWCHGHDLYRGKRHLWVTLNAAH